MVRRGGAGAEGDREGHHRYGGKGTGGTDACHVLLLQDRIRTGSPADAWVKYGWFRGGWPTASELSSTSLLQNHPRNPHVTTPKGAIRTEA
ncbi:hypothetical protein GCM10017589_25570 [Streptomyces poonensis]|nr:hypothetical protein GCM10017589_25570 [Streptomyces poonensis]